jgi:hypothetical protein
MFTIDNNNIIHITRGDTGTISITANNADDESYVFMPGDVVRFKVFMLKQPDKVVLEKDTIVAEETEAVDIILDHMSTKIGQIINKPTDYWYEVELNPDTAPQTIIGYDNIGPKILRLYPEGGERR